MATSFRSLQTLLVQSSGGGASSQFCRRFTATPNFGHSNSHVSQLNNKNKPLRLGARRYPPAAPLSAVNSILSNCTSTTINNYHYHGQTRKSSTSTIVESMSEDDITNTTNQSSSDMKDTYAVAVITSNAEGNTKLSTKNLSIQQIVKEIPGTHARDFFSLSLTSLGDASRKRRAAMMNHYSVKNNIHPWFILPRESEIVVSLSPCCGK